MRRVRLLLYKWSVNSVYATRESTVKKEDYSLVHPSYCSPTQSLSPALHPPVRLAPAHSCNVTDGKIDEGGSQTGRDVACFLPTLLCFYEIVQKIGNARIKLTANTWAIAQSFLIKDERTKWFWFEWKQVFLKFNFLFTVIFIYYNSQRFEHHHILKGLLAVFVYWFCRACCVQTRL
jgi:hypothetical protein